MKINSQKKKIVVFSDVHNEIDKTKKIIEKEAADYNVCLGDWFDSFYYDRTNDYKKTAEYLVNDFFTKNNNISLYGNHDLHYLFENRYLFCSGFEKRKKKAIDEVLTNHNIVDKFKWYIWVDNYLCTHAGLHPYFIDPACNTNEDISSFLDKEAQIANKNIPENLPHWFYGAGRTRGGSFKKGGIVWLDFNDEFECVDNLNQIIGHTNQRNHSCSVLIKDNSYNMCIDCFQNQYLVIQNEKINIKNFIDL